MKFDGFDWDEGNSEKCRKHGVATDEIESAFFTEIRVGPDVKHSADEQRFRAVGKTTKGRFLFVVFTLRGSSQNLFQNAL